MHSLVCVRPGSKPQNRICHGTTYEPRHEKQLFARAKNAHTQISFTVTAKLISTFVVATKIGNPSSSSIRNNQTTSHLVCLPCPSCVPPGLKPLRLFFSQGDSFISLDNQKKTCFDCMDGTK